MPLAQKQAAAPTDKGTNLIALLPDSIQSSRLTAEWENHLNKIANGELAPDVFLGQISSMVERIVKQNYAPKEEFVHLFPPEPQHSEVIGICPRCQSDVVEQGIDYKELSQLLGHSDVTFTLQRYASPDFVFLQDQISLLSSQEDVKSQGNLIQQLLETNQTLSARIQMLEAVVAETMNQILDLNQKLCARLDQMESHHT